MVSIPSSILKILPASLAFDEPPCPKCLTTDGKLCRQHARDVLPQLAVNRGWLKLMGTVVVEQKRRQKPTDDEARRIAKAKRRVQRRIDRLRDTRVARAVNRFSKALALA